MSTTMARPFSPVLLLGAMAISTLVLVAAARWSGAPVEQFDAPVSASRALRFEDTAGGAVAVLDAQSGKEVARFEGEQGFVRGVLRAMSRERKRRGIDLRLPLQLQSHVDGSLTLLDEATGERINLESFGATQRASFASLQKPKASTRTPQLGDTP